eukprot:EG_transcript_27558
MKRPAEALPGCSLKLPRLDEGPGPEQGDVDAPCEGRGPRPLHRQVWEHVSALQQAAATTALPGKQDAIFVWGNPPAGLRRKLAEALNEHFFHIVGQVDQRAIPASGETFLVAQLWISVERYDAVIRIVQQLQPDLAYHHRQPTVAFHSQA